MSKWSGNRRQEALAGSISLTRQSPALIEVQGLTKLYGERPAIRDVTFSVPRGQVLGFLGPNGAGKSTTLRILTGYTGATSGSATVDGFDVLRHSLEVRRRVGYLPETTPLYNEMRVEGFLDHICKLRGIRPSRRRARIDDAIESCGLEERRGEIIGRLSRGLRQRVGLAQAIVHEPEALILDEPTAGLDPGQTRETRELIKQLGRRHTVILSSHILSEVEATCERVLIINQGQLVADGAPGKLAQRLGSGKRHEVEMVVRGEAAAVDEAVRGVAGVDEVTVSAEGEDAVRVVAVTAAADLREKLSRAVILAGFGLLEVQERTLSLEDVFLQLTSAEVA
jgi:gliding motility-associated transport system ATP-binding protein